MTYLGFISDELNLIKSISYLKYYSQFSTYYLRELTLVNFEFEGIKGGRYTQYIGKDKEDYRVLIKNKLMELFIENQKAIQSIYSSTLSLSENNTRFLSEYKIKIGISKIPKIVVNYDILPSLMQYSSAFYNLASSTSLITQNHSNLGNFIFNNLNGYFDGFNILLEIHRQELEKYLRILKLITIIVGIGILCLFCLNFYLIISSFMKAIIIRGNYIKVFFGINETILRNLINNCENLMNRMKTSEEQRFHEEETFNETIDEEIKIVENIKNKKKSISRNSNLNYGIEINSNNKASYTGIIFIIIFGLFNIISYIFIIYNGIYMINTSRKSILINEINMKMHNHHISVIYYFNIYREFLFDDKSEINDINIIKYLDDYEKGKVLGVLEDMDNIGPILSNMVSNISYFAIPLCSYYINDYFDSSNECEEKIGLISKTEITFITTYFFEEIKIGKNFAKIKFK